MLSDKRNVSDDFDDFSIGIAYLHSSLFIVRKDTTAGGQAGFVL
jgi:hypothetical protein